MEVRDPIHGAIEVEDGERAVIDHPLFQRLRNVRQLGFSELAFPSATHNRYGHSIGAMWLSGAALHGIFSNCPLSARAKDRFRRCVRLAMLLHDVGHPPLSHCTESALPPVEDLDLSCVFPRRQGRRATHEDFTLKIITDSSMSAVVATHGGVEPLYVAALIDPDVRVEDGFFVEEGLDYRPLLSQLVSSELDMDRVDYLLRDSHFAGVEYGRFDHRWILAHLRAQSTDGDRVHLALDQRAIYAFDDFLLSRYHMFLMVYYHYRPVVFEEMMRRWFAETGEYAVPLDVEAFAQADDAWLTGRLRASDSEWARRIVDRSPYSLLLERHGGPDGGLGDLSERLEEAGVAQIHTDSWGMLSKYAATPTSPVQGPTLYVVDASPLLPEPTRAIQDSTDLFARYRERRRISRLYVDPDDVDRASRLLEA